MLANVLGADGKSGPKSGFRGLRGAPRRPATTPEVDCVTELGEIARGQMSENPDRRRQARFEAIALPHLDAAYALARWMTRNDADAADVVQEAFLRAFRYFDSYRGDDARSWMLKIVRRACYNWLERNRPADVISLEAEEELSGAVATSAIDAEALLESRSDLRRLDQLIEALPAPLREMIVLRELHEPRLPRNRRGNRRADRNSDVPPSSRPLLAAPRALSKWRHRYRLGAFAWVGGSIPPSFLVATEPVGPFRTTGMKSPRRAVQLLLGHTKIESTVRYLGIEVDDALSIAEQVDV